MFYPYIWINAFTNSHIYRPRSGSRSIVLALAITGILPSINRIGVLGTNAIAAGLAWIGFG